jgi:hypothetical protein
MNLLNAKLILVLLLVVLSQLGFAQRTQQDTMYAYHTAEPVIVDGSADDACWADAEWFSIDQVWIPYNETMKAGDFEGRFKLAWDSLYLYLLAEIVDDSLSDDHANPTDNYWNDDCLEIFIDEDRSKGDHLYNYNAFAYHISFDYDAIDGGTGNTINLKDNLICRMDTIGENTYLWEVAIKNYGKSFNPSNHEASRVYLHHNKLMGFSLAYCDNDETTTRENFIGSVYLPQSKANDSYITADIFGTLLLIDPSVQNTVDEVAANSKGLKLFPNPAFDILSIEYNGMVSSNARIEIRNANGQLISDLCVCEGADVDISTLKRGAYVLSIVDGEKVVSGNFIKQ